jgi:outer membrane cobalamin receptor
MPRTIVRFLAAVFTLSSLPAWAAGTLSGAVRTAQGTPLPQIVLTLAGPSGSLTVVTGPDGRFRAADLAPGQYRLALAIPGFVLTPEPTAVVGESEARLDLTLAPAPVREQVVVAATRGEAPLSTLGISASALDREQIDERQASSFLALLGTLPGVAVARTGGIGLQGSAFVRGGESRFARILVDGVPVNEPGGAFNFGSLLPLELERVEVVRGAASSLYGTDALAGVIQLVTRRPGRDEGPGVHAEAEGGSFAWKRGGAGTSGRAGRFDWNAGIQRLETDNEQPNSAFVQTAGAAALGVAVDSSTSLRFVSRFESSSVGTPGPTAFGRPDLDAYFERRTLVLAGEARHARDSAVHTVRAGFSRADQPSFDPLDSGSYTPRFGERVGAFPLSDFADPQGFENDTRRLSVGYQLELQAGHRNLVTAGVDLERETGKLGAVSGDLISPERTNVGAYVQDRVVLGARVYLTLGGRVEHNDSYGTRAVPRAAIAYRLRGGADATTLKASAGAGIKEPGFFESFGVSFYAKGNPNLEPERSRTVDLGIEQRLGGGRLRAEATAFHHDYRDQIAYQVVDFTTFEGSYVNLGKTRARGLELALEASPARGLNLGAQYTYLDGEVAVSASDFDPVYAVGEPLLRRPKHHAALTATGERGRVRGGATLVLVGRRADSDFVGLGLRENDGYTRVDARVRVRITAGLEAFLVGENVLDREYMEVLGFPALGRSVRAGLRFRTGGAARP